MYDPDTFAMRNWYSLRLLVLEIANWLTPKSYRFVTAYNMTKIK